jgi:Flp pilus assembly protein TadD
MNCVNCGAFLTDMDLDYCPNCGYNVLIQKKVDYLSKSFYNQGLEKASIRDLSGAIACLKQSLIYDKRNIKARNLLGLVYFETGEVVSALSEWVISKNLQPSRNLASEYINKLQANSNKLEAINETIRKYNDALNLCREGHEDMAAIRLKKILAQNPKLIKGYHLLALIQMKEGEYNKARRTLKRAARIDKTNTTTLRFLSEIDEQTGVSTRLERQKKRRFGSKGAEEKEAASISRDMVIPTAPYKERSRVSLFFTLVAGFAAGLLAFYLLAVPAIKQGIYREANQQIVKYSDAVSSQGAELTKAQNQAQESGDTVEAASKQIEEEKKKSDSYEALLEAYAALQQQNADEAALKLQNVYADLLPADLKGIYNTICNSTGTTGIEGTTDSTSQNGSDSTGGDVSDNGDNADAAGDASSDSAYDENYDDGSYDSGNDEVSYDTGSYDESYDEGSYDDSEY